MPPGDNDDFEVEIDDDDFEVEIDDASATAKYKPGDKVIAVGGALPGADKAVAVVTIEKSIDWSTVNPEARGQAYVVKHEWGDSLAMSVYRRNKQGLSVSIENKYYVDWRDIHPYAGERSTNSIRKKLFPSTKKRRA
jgi:hypothetical protein